VFDVVHRRLPVTAVAWFTAAAVAAAAAFILVRAHVARIEASRPDVGPPSPVVVAADDLPRGSTISAGSVRVADVPSSLLPPGAIGTPDGVVGRILVADVAEGEPLTVTRLAGLGGGPVAAQVPTGLRAFVLPVGPPAGTVRPGDRVDVVATYGANAGRPYTDTVATALEVLEVVEGAASTSSSTAGGVSGPPVVVLADPITVEALARASSLAVLSIAIVGSESEAPFQPVS
jgi:pilus assembly protein CpaB